MAQNVVHVTKSTSDEFLKELTESARLDLVARAEVTKTLLYRNRIPLTFVSAFFVLLAMVSGASFYETLAVRVLAVFSVVTTVMLWLKWRYAVYMLPLLFLSVLAAGWSFDDPDYHTSLGSLTRYLISAMVAFVGYRWWANGMPFVAGSSEALEKERFQVKQWLEMLMSTHDSDQIVEISTGSFLSGYWTYRFLKTGAFWVVAKFKKGKTDRVLNCRVYELAAVSVTHQSGETLIIEAGDRTISVPDLPQAAREHLLQLVNARMP